MLFRLCALHRQHPNRSPAAARSAIVTLDRAHSPRSLRGGLSLVVMPVHDDHERRMSVRVDVKLNDK